MHVAVATAAAAHSNLLFSRDLEFKNISPLDREGSFVVFDLEWAISLAGLAGREDNKAIEQVSKAIERDLDDVRKSMRGFIYPNLPPGTRPVSDQDQLDYELAHLYEPYYSAIMKSESPHVNLLDRAYRQLLERRRNAVKASGSAKQE